MPSTSDLASPAATERGAAPRASDAAAVRATVPLRSIAPRRGISRRRRPADERVDWLRSIPFWSVHLACLGAVLPGARPTWTALLVGVGLYTLRAFAITGFYHRYFAHRAFTMNRFWTFVAGVLGTLAVQKGPLWWAGHHRTHHRFSDEAGDVHSPVARGFFWSHLGWILCRKYGRPDNMRIADFHRYPELRWLDRNHLVAPIALAMACFLLGGWSVLVCGFFWSTVALWHATFCVNSLAHVWGRRRYPTGDASRNNWFVAILTLGEGWHNNHHHYMHSARQGFFWWEYDVTYYVLKMLSWVAIVSDLRTVPDHLRFAHVAGARA
ncbi:MAG: acyl-CoA desaturase [Planctomycetes bacterium]|nr:acyl-CoA desaturase [Planctomycetota bacterium]